MGDRMVIFLRGFQDDRATDQSMMNEYPGTYELVIKVYSASNQRVIVEFPATNLFFADGRVLTKLGG